LIPGAIGVRHDASQTPNLERWRRINERIRNPEGAVTIAVVGKYTGSRNAYNP